VQPGIAVLDGDHWTVSRETWCKLSQNAGEYPPACGEPAPTTTTIETTTTTVPAIEPFTYEADGPLVRGASVTLTLHGLDRLAGQQVELAFSDGLPEERLYNYKDPAGGMTGGVVDGDGNLVTHAFVPNRLMTGDGSHDYPLVEAEHTYDLFVTAGSSWVIWYRSTLRIEAATPGVAYRSLVRNNVPNGTSGCGAPSFEVELDGHNWTPDDAAAFAPDELTFPGTFTLLADNKGRFTLEDGSAVLFSESPAWFC